MVKFSTVAREKKEMEKKERSCLIVRKKKRRLEVSEPKGNPKSSIISVTAF